MADYYPLISRAIGRLESSSAEARRSVYEHARASLLKQLDAFDPPLNDSEKTSERLALEQAIRKVEVESAKSGYIV
jgi:hypothetical protein